ncbi:MAG TPA: stage II sporulation protein E [Thermoanaerobacterales bacterium]|nr:stage II sporulation protein E [Thermoanaerobacterales bacterium]
MVERTGVLLYQDVLDNKKVFKNKILIERFILSVIGFLLARISILGGLYPFGIAFYAATCYKRKRFLSVGASVILGILFANPEVGALRYILAILLFSIAYLSDTKDNSPLLKPYILIFAASLFSNLIFIWVKGFLLFDVIAVFFESFMILVLTLMFNFTIPFQFDGDSIIGNISSEKIISVAVLGGLVIGSLGDFRVLGLSIRIVSEMLVIFIAAYIGGTGLSSTAGAVLPIIYSFTSGVSPMVIGVYAFGGVLAGLFKRMGKLGIVSGFFIGTVLMNYYINNYAFHYITSIHYIVALGLFLMIPNRTLNLLKVNLLHDIGNDISSDRMNERLVNLTSQRLKNLSDVLRQLSSTFETASSEIPGEENLDNLYNQLTNNICSSCHMAKHCWERNFYNTYKEIFNLILIIENKGDIRDEDIPDFFVDQCLKTNQFKEMISTYIASYKKDYHLQKKMSESKKLVANQLDGISKIIRDLAGELKPGFRFDSQIEDKIRKQLSNKGIRIDDVYVMDYGNGKIEVNIKKGSCYGKRHCNNEIPVVISEILNNRITVKANNCTLRDGSNSCVLSLAPAESYEVAMGTAVVAKSPSNISGDTFLFNKLDNGRFMLAISDGMGTGEIAAEESDAALSLLEQLIGAGFDNETAIRTINSALILRSLRDSFSTIDMALIDLYNGELDLVKIGAPASFIKRGKDVDILKASSLPVGIIDEIEPENIEMKLLPGDFIVMVSDGLLIGPGRDINEEEWLKEIIADIDTRNPQKMADLILEAVLMANKHDIKDDMTVIVAKLWERKDLM